MTPSQIWYHFVRFCAVHPHKKKFPKVSFLYDLSFLELTRFLSHKQKKTNKEAEDKLATVLKREPVTCQCHWILLAEHKTCMLVLNRQWLCEQNCYTMLTCVYIKHEICVTKTATAIRMQYLTGRTAPRTAAVRSVPIVTLCLCQCGHRAIQWSDASLNKVW